MNSAEKPFEFLSPSEKGVFEICKDIIECNDPDLQGPELMKLRERATALFAKMRLIDVVHHDDYYKHVGEAKALEAKFKTLHEDTKTKSNETRYINSEFVKSEQDIDQLIDLLITSLAGRYEVRSVIYWMSSNQDSPYTDCTRIKIIPASNNSDFYTLDLGEMFNPVRLQDPTQIGRLWKELFSDDESVIFATHFHGLGAGPREDWLRVEHINQEALKRILNRFADIVKKHPRPKRWY